MSSPSQEHLLGYVLGALEPLEQEQLERELAKDSRLARQAEVLAERLQPLESYRPTEEPPPGLAERCCAKIFDQIAPQERVAEQRVTPARQGLPAAMQADLEGDTSRWSLTDMVVAAGIFLGAGMLFFPAIANSRDQARMAQCQNNLRQLGESYTNALNARPNFENVTLMGGNRVFAGIQAPLLKDGGYLQRDSALVCPGSPLAEERRDFRIASASEIDRAEGEELQRLQRNAAGSLAFSLGFRPQPAGSAPTPSSDMSPLAADAPSGALPNIVSSHHDGHGQNVVFKSGRVAYVRGCGDVECGDSIFWNRRGVVDAGLDQSDFVLAPSGTRPFTTSQVSNAID